MSGSNANFRNSATDKDYTLRKDAGHLSAAVFSKANPQQGLNSIACGETKQDSLTTTTFKSAFRFDDLVANQRYYSVLFTFREDVANPDVKVYVRSTSFTPWVTVWRNASNKFAVDKDLSIANELVVPVDVTSELTGPFIIEVSSEDPYATGDFEVELVCTGATPLTGNIKLATRDHRYAYQPNFPLGPAIVSSGPPSYTVSPAGINLAFVNGLVGYTWAITNDDSSGFTMPFSNGFIVTPGGTFGGDDPIGTQPNWSTFPNVTHPLPKPGDLTWDDSMYSDDWRGGNRNGVLWTCYNIKLQLSLTGGASPGPYMQSIPVIATHVQADVQATLPSGVTGFGTPTTNSRRVYEAPTGNPTWYEFATYAGGNTAGNGGIGITHKGTGWVATLQQNINDPGLAAGSVINAIYRSAITSSFGTFTLDFIGIQYGGHPQDWFDLTLFPSFPAGGPDLIGAGIGGGSATISAN